MEPDDPPVTENPNYRDEQRAWSEQVRAYAKDRATEHRVDYMPIHTSITSFYEGLEHRHSLDYGILEFGGLYTTTEILEPNRMGHFKPGEVYRFLGFYVFPYDNGLRLYFENGNMAAANLEFEGNFPEAAGVIRYITQKETPEFFRLLRADNDARGAQLRALKEEVLAEAGRRAPSRPSPYL